MAVTTSAPERPAKAGDNEALRANQVRQAEELLFSGPSRSDSPRRSSAAISRRGTLPLSRADRRRAHAVDKAVAEVRRSPTPSIDAAAIDRDADIPPSVIDGLADLGVLGMTAPVEFGGRGFSQLGYCRIMEIIGGHCSVHGRVRQRPSFHRHPGPGPVRHARAAATLAARSGQRQEAGGVRPDRDRKRAPTPPTCRPRPRPAPTARRTSSTAKSATSPTAPSPRC